jgi:V8-like Glu-specific endopeptidase
VVFAVGRVTPNGVQLLGTAFLLPRSGFLATAAHVVGNDDQNLVLAIKPTVSPGSYQDTSDNSVQMLPLKVHASDPFHDIVVLNAVQPAAANVAIGGADDVVAGDELVVVGYPHADHGRMVLTQQATDLGAKVLIEAGGLKGKHLVLNIQSRPGQSGSPIFKKSDGKLVGILLGSYVPGSGGGISLGGIDPATLHQTTHAVSAEYLRDMIK